MYVKFLLTYSQVLPLLGNKTQWKASASELAIPHNTSRVSQVSGTVVYNVVIN